MEEKFEMNSGNDDNNEKRDKGRGLTGGLVSLTLVLLAVITVFIVVNNRLSAGNTEGSGLSGAISSCCSTGAAASSEEQLAQAGLSYYRANSGDTEGLEALVDDFGCHQEISIQRNGEEIRRYSYSNDTFYDITR
jgi:hypothetical protein